MVTIWALIWYSPSQTLNFEVHFFITWWIICNWMLVQWTSKVCPFHISKIFWGDRYTMQQCACPLNPLCLHSAKQWSKNGDQQRTASLNAADSLFMLLSLYWSNSQKQTKLNIGYQQSISCSYFRNGLKIIFLISTNIPPQKKERKKKKRWIDK